ncbi:MAG: 50S ribosomal protein L9 [Chlamydiales bacterium]|nr:50S ribosomal protein L9 [Chlamydiales bacterium]
MQYQLLLLEDISGARKGEIIKATPGFARNYLLPQKKAVVVDKRTVRLQERLKEERAKQAKEDRVVAEQLVRDLQGKSFTTIVKVDPDGHMYGSVSTADVSSLLKDHGFNVHKRHVYLIHPIKTLGEHTIELHLKEGVKTSFKLTIESDTPIAVKQKKEDQSKEPQAEEKKEEEKA